jgi:hypothetical protein
MPTGSWTATVEKQKDLKFFNFQHNIRRLADIRIKINPLYFNNMGDLLFALSRLKEEKAIRWPAPNPREASLYPIRLTGDNILPP